MPMKNALLLDLKVLICKEDMDKFGLSEDAVIMDAEDIGGETKANIVPFSYIIKEMEAANHLMLF